MVARVNSSIVLRDLSDNPLVADSPGCVISGAASRVPDGAAVPAGASGTDPVDGPTGAAES